ncbi:MAG: heme-degrading domain-containing protein [Spirochaetales bacterium]|nr:heme-degrading domain-containing protein [Spirochaetales bacterium]
MDILIKLVEEERVLQFDTFSHSRALELGNFLADRARDKNLAIAIHIDRNGQSLFHYALPGTTIDNDLWLAGKINVVYYFQHSSYYVKKMLLSKDKEMKKDLFLDPGRYRASGGAFPIIVKGSGIVAAAAVSGLPDKDDHEFLTEAIGSFLEL